MGIHIPFSQDTLKIDTEKETERIIEKIHFFFRTKFMRTGAVVALSGGIDSSVVAVLCVRALGKDRVTGLLLPEKESSEDTIRLSKLVAKHLGIDSVYTDITSVLDALGCYQKRDEAIRKIIPEYTSEYKVKISLPPALQSSAFRLFYVTVASPEGKEIKKRLTSSAHRGIIAAVNFKQRVRKMLEYHHADRLNYAVAGTSNRLEHDQGFFVKLGDGAGDFKPIVHLYKTQVYQLAEYLEIPDEIQQRRPTPDTYSLPLSSEEFYFTLPFEKMDLCIYGMNNDVPIEDVAKATELSTDEVQQVYREIDRKRKATNYLHLPPQFIEEIDEVPV